MTNRNDRFVEQASDSIHVLLVEDRPEDAFVIEKLLRKQASEEQELQITHAKTLADASELLAGDALFHCVLLDLGLPDSRGLRTLSRLHHVNSRIPILVLSGIDDEQTSQAAVRLGAHGYLAKQDISRSENVWGAILGAILSATPRAASFDAELKRVGVVRLDDRQRVLRWDEHCELLTNWPAEHVNNKPFYDLVSKSQRDDVRALLEQPQKALDRPLEFDLLDPKGKIRRMELAPQLSFEGVREQQWSLSEAYEARQGYQALQLLNAVLAVSNDLVLSIDLDGRIRSCGDVSARLLGIPAEEMVDKSIADLFGPTQVIQLRKVLGALRRGVSLAIPIQMGQGELARSYSLHAMPIRDDLGGLVGGCVIAGLPQD